MSASLVDRVPTPARRVRALCVLGLLVVVTLATLWSRARSNTPEGVCSGTLTALERQDVGALLALADPVELQRLHLTPQAVRAVLGATLWSGGYRGPHRWSVAHRTSVDAVLFEVRAVPGSPEAGRAPLQLSVLDDRKAGWRLNLSALLYYACFRHAGGSLAGGRALWGTMKRQHDIWGIRQPSDGTYTLWKRTAAPPPA